MFQAEATPSGFFFLAPWIVFAPVLGLLINSIFGRRLSERTVGTIASLASGAAFVVSVLLAWSVLTLRSLGRTAGRSSHPFDPPNGGICVAPRWWRRRLERVRV